jgi:hypothetical protein
VCAANHANSSLARNSLLCACVCARARCRCHILITHGYVFVRALLHRLLITQPLSACVRACVCMFTASPLWQVHVVDDPHPNGRTRATVPPRAQRHQLDALRLPAVGEGACRWHVHALPGDGRERLQPLRQQLERNIVVQAALPWSAGEGGLLHHMLCHSHAASHALLFTQCTTRFVIHMLYHSHAAPPSLPFTCCTNCFCHSHTALPASHTTPPASHTAFVIPTLHCLLHILHHLLHILLLSFVHCIPSFVIHGVCVFPYSSAPRHIVSYAHTNRHPPTLRPPKPHRAPPPPQPSQPPSHSQPCKSSVTISGVHLRSALLVCVSIISQTVPLICSFARTKVSTLFFCRVLLFNVSLSLVYEHFICLHALQSFLFFFPFLFCDFFSLFLLRDRPTSTRFAMLSRSRVTSPLASTSSGGATTARPRRRCGRTAPTSLSCGRAVDLLSSPMRRPVVRVRVLRADRLSERLRVLRADWFCAKCDFVPSADGQRHSVSCCALPLLNHAARV